MTTELTIVIPTYNERDNIQPIIQALSSVLEGIKWEVIFVDDDSGDNTSSAIREFAQKDLRIRCIQRLKRRGLSSACVEGVLASSSPYVCIMDADLQHDENILLDMLDAIKTNDIDIVIGSRYVKCGSTGFLPKQRVWISRIATYLSRIVLKQDICDPLSGYFMLSRSFFEKVMNKLSGNGFKILLDILVVAGPSVKIMELPYVMRERVKGESKLNYVVAWEFLTLVGYKYLGRLLPVRFISFAAVGLSGIFMHLSALWFFFSLLDINFTYAQFYATLIAMTSNYTLNNFLTYADRKHHGIAFFQGLLTFYLACSIGVVINVAIADQLFARSLPWWLAGVSGVIAGAVWNYVTTATFTWKINGTKSS